MDKKIDPITQVLDVIKEKKYATDKEIEIIDERVSPTPTDARKPVFSKNFVSRISTETREFSAGGVKPPSHQQTPFDPNFLVESDMIAPKGSMQLM